VSEQRDLSTADRLRQPFDPLEVKWKAQAVKNNRALAVAYIDARVVMDRLDDVLGVGGWSDVYEVLPGGSVVCRLTAVIDGREVTKTDVGSPSEQPDEGDKMKAAFSDALKRAAVKLSVGRYLYRLPHQWVDYDPVKKQFARTPDLPSWAFPGGLDKAKKNLTRTVTQARPDGPILSDQKARIDELVLQAGWSERQFVGAVKKYTKKADPAELTASEAAMLIEKMEARLQTA
jgi:hypothetical protein